MFRMQAQEYQPETGVKAMQIADLCFLVAEDHEFQRSALVRVLTSLGAKDILAAADGRSALALLKASKRPIDIIISDLDMPGMDGMEFVRHLRSEERRVGKECCR